MNRDKIRQQLVDHYLDLYQLAYSMLNDEDDARDAVQEALACTMARPLLDKPLAYCYQVLRRTAINTIRHRARIIPIQTEIAEELRDEESETAYGELLDYAMRLRDNLPQATRALIVLHDEKGHSYSELATLTGMNVMTVRRHIKKAHNDMLQKLKKRKEDIQ
jgi:RNA polymerase sigma factor (sigma-70 family)